MGECIQLIAIGGLVAGPCLRVDYYREILNLKCGQVGYQGSV